MNGQSRSSVLWACSVLCALCFANQFAVADEPQRDVLLLTSTNDPAGNQVIVFKLETQGTPVLSVVNTLPTGGKGGASNNAGILQFDHDLGAVANYGSNSVSRLARHDDSIDVEDPIKLAPGCANPDSVALSKDHLFVVGATCAESHVWPSGALDGTTVHFSDPSAAQIAVGRTWGAATFTSGSVLQLGLTADGALSGVAALVTLPSDANNTPLGAAFWHDILAA